MSDSLGKSYQDLVQSSSLERIEARMLLELASKKSRTWLMANSTNVAPDSVLQHFLKLCERRHSGEPMAYIIGLRDFFGLTFSVNEHVLIPRADTEVLVQWAIDYCPRNALVLELGTGSGCIACALAYERGDLTICATDVTAQALRIAKRNGQTLVPDSAIEWIQSDWYAAFDPTLAQAKTSFRRFDAIISNPPYIRANDLHLTQGDLRFEPISALTDHNDGLSAIKTIINGASQHLNERGLLALEHGFDQAPAVSQLLADAGFDQIRTHADLAGLDRITTGQII
jgi:release factor glutamine methyltransferase